MSLLELFQTLEETTVGETIRTSLWLFPVIEATHLIGISLLGGAILVVDLRLLGVGLTKQPIGVVVNHAKPYLLGSLALIFATGIPIALSEMIKLYYNFSFWVKMSTLGIALIYTFVVKNQIILRENTPRALLGCAGFVSIALWFTVAGAGRWIGFS